MTNIIKPNMTVLFQGDSITDAGRSRETDDNLGAGYVMMIASWYSAMFPTNNVRFVNRGVSGDRVKDLKSRWQKDCLDVKPDVLSIMVGINDTWRRYDSNDPTTTDQFESGYRDILTQIKTSLPDTKIIICEPFLLHATKDIERFREDLNPKIKSVRKLVKEFKTKFIPLDKIFAEVSAVREPAFWASDSVHPTPAGHALITQKWLQAVNIL
jgi:lysophospholipase L1-like esterase